MPFACATALLQAAGSPGFSNDLTVTTYRLYLWSFNSFWTASWTSPFRLPSTFALSTMLVPEGMVTGSSAQAAPAGTASSPARPITARIRLNFDRMCNPSARLTPIRHESVVESSSAPTLGVKPQVAVAFHLDSMVHHTGSPCDRICLQRNAPRPNELA